MRAVTRLALFLLFLLQAFEPFGQTAIKPIGTPLIRQYKRSDFNAGRQTWMIEQGVNGMMYFANNDGLLEYDGSGWNTYQLPNRTIVRCIKSDGLGHIYAGGFNEIGYFLTDSSGQMTYRSYIPLLPDEERDFGEAWKIHLTPFGAVFQSFSKLMIIRGEHVEMIKAPDQFHFSYYVNGELYVVDRSEGLLRLAMGKLFPVVGCESLRGKEIWGIIPFDGKLLISTSGEGIFIYDGSALKPWAGKTTDKLCEAKVFCVSLIDPGTIAFGTIQNGILITDLKGNILQSINRDRGLQNNTVLSMNIDDYGNLWLGLDNGIDYLEINSPLSVISYQYGINSGYAAMIHDSILYLGTNQGVYATSWSNSASGGNPGLHFRLIEGTSGQVWTLQEINGQIFCGHNNGTFLINKYQARKISEVSGGWKYLQLDDPGKIIGGTYSGFILFKKVNGEWVFSHKIKGFEESSRDFFIDGKENLWMSHGFKGLFKIHFNDALDSVTKVDFYDSSSGLPSDYGMTLFNFRDSIYITTETGVYHYNYSDQQFLKSAAVTKILGDFFYRKITRDASGNLWYFMDDRAGVYRLQEDGTYLDITLPFEPVSGSFIGGFQFVYPYDNHNVFFGSESGFIHYDPSFVKDYAITPSVYIRDVSISVSDSLLFHGVIQGASTIRPDVDFKNNSLRFFFSANDFENPERLEYSSTLSGLEGSWSSWTTQNNREFANLHEGDYVFKVKARNIYMATSDEATFSFTIEPPWRRSTTAFILYGFIVILAAFTGVVLMRKKINRSRKEAEVAKEIQFRQREDELKRNSLEAEKEVIRLRNEKLREEMVLKDKELANSTLQMIQKNKLLVSLKNDLNHLNSLSRDPDLKNHVRSLIKKINKDIDSDSQWKVFETHFEKVHEEFLKRIKVEFPDLTPSELKLCAYLRLNISSKEIALLMNISTRGVEISRYRLRRKLGLDRQSNLTDFILSY